MIEMEQVRHGTDVCVPHRYDYSGGQGGRANQSNHDKANSDGLKKVKICEDEEKKSGGKGVVVKIIKRLSSPPFPLKVNRVGEWPIPIFK